MADTIPYYNGLLTHAHFAVRSFYTFSRSAVMHNPCQTLQDSKREVNYLLIAKRKAKFLTVKQSENQESDFGITSMKIQSCGPSTESCALYWLVASIVYTDRPYILLYRRLSIPGRLSMLVGNPVISSYSYVLHLYLSNQWHPLPCSKIFKFSFTGFTSEI